MTASLLPRDVILRALQQKDYEGALHRLAEFQQSEPERLEWRYWTGVAYSQTNQPERARAEFEAVIKLSKDDALRRAARQKLLKSVPGDVVLPPVPIVDEPTRQKSQDWGSWFRDQPLLIKQQATLGLVLGLVITALVGTAAFLIASNLRTQLSEQSRNELKVLALGYDNKIDQMGFDMRSHAAYPGIVDALILRQGNPTVRRLLVQESQALNVEFITLVDAQGRIVESINRPRTGERFDPQGLVSEALRIDRQIKSSEFVTLKEIRQEDEGIARALSELPSFAKAEGALIRYVVTPVRSGRRVVGALVAGDLVNGKGAITDGTLDVLRGGFAALLARNPSTPTTAPQVAAFSMVDGGDLARPYLRSADIPNEVSRLQPNQPTTLEATVGGQQFAVAAVSLRNYRQQVVGVLLRGSPRAALTELLTSSILIELAIGGGIFLIALLLGRQLARSITEPLLALKEQAGRLAAGEGSVRAQVESYDEVGELARTFNTMAESIQRTTQAVREESELRRREAQQQLDEKENLQAQVMQLLDEVAPATLGDLTVRAYVSKDEMGTVADTFNAMISYLNEVVRQVKGATAQVGETATRSERSIQQLATEANRQREQIATAVAEVQLMGASIEAVSASARQAEVFAQKATEAAQTGGGAMESTVQTIQNLRFTVAETAKKVKRLGEVSQEISRIVELIGQISNRTNLLALNASVEAARAGKEGRGFKTVAEEVRRLAERTTDAAQEIEVYVQSIQLETGEVIAAMETSTEQVVVGTERIEAATASLGELIAINRQVDELSQVIAQATVQQTYSSREITSTMQAISAISETTATEALTVFDALRQMVGVVGELQESVDRFQVEGV